MQNSFFETYPTLPEQFPYPWNSAYGEDRSGIWVEFAIPDTTGKKVKQRMRWINPGRFLMGSPVKEKERYDNETLHVVTITQGYWLADTACTQALWEAVMGDNPSYFKMSLLPVENVSWNDCKEFLEKINNHPVLAGISLCLPTEAQWEYACRAGTLTPFSYGENITTDQINCDGNYLYTGGKKGEYREQTVAVRSFPPNNWGLYQMHGNVWEWCSDCYDRNYYEQCKEMGRVENPQGPEEGGSRVLRGGSWFSGARGCRSANRDHSDPHGPGDRGSGIGFRLSRGLENLELKKRGQT